MQSSKKRNLVNSHKRGNSSHSIFSSFVAVILCLSISGLLFIIHSNLVFAGTINIANLNMTFGQGVGVEVGLEQTVQINGTGFSNYANQDISLNMYLENNSGWWDKTNLQWGFPTLVSVDSQGNFSYNWSLPYQEKVASNATINITIGSGQYVMAGNMTLAVANKSVEGGLYWVKRNMSVNAQSIFVDPTLDSIFIGYSNGSVAAMSKSLASSPGNTFYGESNYQWQRTVGTTQVEEVWSDGTNVFSVASVVANGLSKLNAATGAIVTQVANPAAAYSIFGDSTYLFIGYAANTAMRKYDKNLIQVGGFAPAAVNSITSDVWSDASAVYGCYANGSVYAFNGATGAQLWNRAYTTQACNGIYGNNNGVIFSGHNAGAVIAYNATTGAMLWRVFDYANYNILNIWASNYSSTNTNINNIFASYSDGRIVIFGQSSGATKLIRHYAYHVPGVAVQGNSITGDEKHIYSAHNTGWIFKIGQYTDNIEYPSSTQLWIRDLADTWNVIMRPAKPIFYDSETPQFSIMVFDNKTNPIDIRSGNLQGTYLYTRTSRHSSQFEAVASNDAVLDPRISSALTPDYRFVYYNNLTSADCPATHYDFGGYNYSNRTGWHMYDTANGAAGAAWCLYFNETIAPPIYTLYNGTKLPTYQLQMVRPFSMMNTSNEFMTTISLNSSLRSAVETNLTKYYGADKYSWASVYGLRTSDYQLDTGVIGFIKKSGANYSDSWANKFGQSDSWRVGRTGNTDSRYAYSYFNLGYNSTPYEFYWIFADTNNTYISQNIENSAIAIANPINITVSVNESNNPGWSVDGSLFRQRVNLTLYEPNTLTRLDEPINFTFNPQNSITASCNDIRITDENSNLVIHQIETCSPTNVLVWLFANITLNYTRNLTVYYNSTAAAPTYTAMSVTLSGTCPTQSVSIANIGLAFESNYSKSVNWSAWGADSGENISYNYGNQSPWMTNGQNLYWANNNGTATTAVGGWNQRCIAIAGPIYTKVWVNQTAMVAVGGRTLSIYGQAYVFGRSGRVKIVMQANRTLSDLYDNYPSYFRYGFDTFSPQNKTGTNLYHVWTDWGGRKEMLDKSIYGEPLVEYSNFTGYDNSPTQVNLRFPLPYSFEFNLRVGTPSCMGHQLMDYFIYRNSSTPAGAAVATLAEFQSHDFAVCADTIPFANYSTGWSILMPDIRLYGTTLNRWVDTAALGPYTYGRFYLLQNNYTPFSRESRYYPIMTTQYLGSRATFGALGVCPRVEDGYSSYSDVLNDIDADFIANNRVNSGTHECLMPTLKLIDTRGGDKTEFFVMKNATVFFGETRRVDEPYPLSIANGNYSQTTANQLAYWYGNWTATFSNQPYIIHGMGTSGNPQYQDYAYYYFAPQQYFNKVVWNESSFWDKNQTLLTGGNGVDIGPETADSAGFSCNLAAATGATLESTTRKGWTHIGTVANACPYSSENMKHYAYARPSFTNYISIATGGSTGVDYDFYIFGRSNYTAQVGTHNSLIDFGHYADATGTDPQNNADLNESKYHENKNPWICYESSRISRSFCIATVSSSSFVYSATAGTANEQLAFGQDYSSAQELNRFSFFSNTRWGGGSYYPTDYRARKINYQYLAPGEFDLNLLYAGAGLSDNKMGSFFPDIVTPLAQGYLQGFDAGNTFWLSFDSNSREYSVGSDLNVNGTLFINDTRMSNTPFILSVMSPSDALLSNTIVTTDSQGRFSYTYSVPQGLDAGEYYVKADYQGIIVSKFGFTISSTSIAVDTDKIGYSPLETVYTTMTITDTSTGAATDPDTLVIRHTSEDGTEVRCSKYPALYSVTNCANTLTKNSTGVYTDSYSLSSGAATGSYQALVTATFGVITINSGVDYVVASFTGFIRTSLNNTIAGTNYYGVVNAQNTGATFATKQMQVTVPTMCASITNITNSTGGLVTYQVNDLSSACSLTWTISLSGNQENTYTIYATIPTTSGFIPSITLSAPNIISTNVPFSVIGFVKNAVGVLTNCDANLTLQVKDLTSNSTLVNANMSQEYSVGPLGGYNYTLSLVNQSSYLISATCLVSGISYTSSPFVLSTQNVSINQNTSQAPVISSQLVAPTTVAGQNMTIVLQTNANTITPTCSPAQLTIRDVLGHTTNHTNMSSYATGSYWYNLTTNSSPTIYLLNASCSMNVSTTSGLTTTQQTYASAIVSTTQASSGSLQVSDYLQIAQYVWNNTDRNITYYNQSSSDSLVDCLQNANCSNWWINSSLESISTQVAQVNTTLFSLNITMQQVLDELNCTTVNISNSTLHLCTQLSNLSSNISDIYSRIEYINSTQLLQLQVDVQTILTNVTTIYNEMATAAQVQESLVTLSNLSNLTQGVLDNITNLDIKLDLVLGNVSHMQLNIDSVLGNLTDLMDVVATQESITSVNDSLNNVSQLILAVQALISNQNYTTNLSDITIMILALNQSVIDTSSATQSAIFDVNASLSSQITTQMNDSFIALNDVLSNISALNQYIQENVASQSNLTDYFGNLSALLITQISSLTEVLQNVSDNLTTQLTTMQVYVGEVNGSLSIQLSENLALLNTTNEYVINITTNLTQVILSLDNVTNLTVELQNLVATSANISLILDNLSTLTTSIDSQFLAINSSLTSLTDLVTLTNTNVLDTNSTLSTILLEVQDNLTQLQTYVVTTVATQANISDSIVILTNVVSESVSNSTSNITSQLGDIDNKIVDINATISAQLQQNFDLLNLTNELAYNLSQNMTTIVLALDNISNQTTALEGFIAAAANITLVVNNISALSASMDSQFLLLNDSLVALQNTVDAVNTNILNSNSSTASGLNDILSNLTDFYSFVQNNVAMQANITILLSELSNQSYQQMLNITQNITTSVSELSNTLLAINSSLYSGLYDEIIINRQLINQTYFATIDVGLNVSSAIDLINNVSNSTQTIIDIVATANNVSDIISNLSEIMAQINSQSLQVSAMNTSLNSAITSVFDLVIELNATTESNYVSLSDNLSIMRINLTQIIDSLAIVDTNLSDLIFYVETTLATQANISDINVSLEDVQEELIARLTSINASLSASNTQLQTDIVTLLIQSNTTLSYEDNLTRNIELSLELLNNLTDSNQNITDLNLQILNVSQNIFNTSLSSVDFTNNVSQIIGNISETNSNVVGVSAQLNLVNTSLATLLDTIGLNTQAYNQSAIDAITDAINRINNLSTYITLSVATQDNLTFVLTNISSQMTSLDMSTQSAISSVLGNLSAVNNSLIGQFLLQEQQINVTHDYLSNLTTNMSQVMAALDNVTNASNQVAISVQQLADIVNNLTSVITQAVNESINSTLSTSISSILADHIGNSTAIISAQLDVVNSSLHVALDTISANSAAYNQSTVVSILNLLDIVGNLSTYVQNTSATQGNLTELLTNLSNQYTQLDAALTQKVDSIISNLSAINISLAGQLLSISSNIDVVLSGQNVSLSYLMNLTQNMSLVSQYLDDIDNRTTTILNTMATSADLSADSSSILSQINELNDSLSSALILMQVDIAAYNQTTVSDILSVSSNLSLLSSYIYAYVATQANITSIISNTNSTGVFDGLNEIISRLVYANSSLTQLYTQVNSQYTNLTNQANANWLNLSADILSRLATQTFIDNMSTTIASINSLQNSSNTILSSINCSSASELCTYLRDINTSITAINQTMATASQVNALSLLSTSQYNGIISWMQQNVSNVTQITALQNLVSSLQVSLLAMNISLHNSTQTILTNLVSVNESLAYQINQTNNSLSSNISDAALANAIATANILSNISAINTSIQSSVLAAIQVLQSSVDALSANSVNTSQFISSMGDVSANLSLILGNLAYINDSSVDILSYLSSNLSDRMLALELLGNQTYEYTVQNLSLSLNTSTVILLLGEIQQNLTLIQNNMLTQGNATGNFITNYYTAPSSSVGKSQEMYITTRDLLGNDKTVISASCGIQKDGIVLANITPTILSGAVLVNWTVPYGYVSGVYAWNCTLIGSTMNIYVPFYVMAPPQFSIASLTAGTPRYPNENALVEATFISEDGSSVIPDSITLQIYDKNNNLWASATQANMTVSNNVWSYSKSIESNPTTGYYTVHMNAHYNNQTATSTTQYRVATGGPYRVYLNCPTSATIGSDLSCSLQIQDEGETETESISTVWIDVNNNSITDSGEILQTFSKRTTPQQNVTETAHLSIPSSYSAGTYLIRVETIYVNSPQPASLAADTVIFVIPSATTTTPASGASGAGGTSSSGAVITNATTGALTAQQLAEIANLISANSRNASNIMSGALQIISYPSQVFANDTVTYKIVIYNNGTEILDTVSASISGLNPKEYSISPSVLDIGPNRFSTFDLTFEKSSAAEADFEIFITSRTNSASNYAILHSTLYGTASVENSDASENSSFNIAKVLSLLKTIVFYSMIAVASIALIYGIILGVGKGIVMIKGFSMSNSVLYNNSSLRNKILETSFRYKFNGRNSYTDKYKSAFSSEIHGIESKSILSRIKDKLTINSNPREYGYNDIEKQLHNIRKISDSLKENQISFRRK